MDLQAFFNKKGNEQFLDIALELVARKDEVLKAHIKTTIKAIGKIIENDYKEYKAECYDDDLYMWHNDFNQMFCFYIAAEIINKEKKMCLKIDLWDYNTQQTTKLTPKLREVLGVSNNDIFDDSTLKDDKRHLALKEFEKIDLIDFTQEKFINFFESVKDKVYQFNQKIADDLAKGKDSKLREFLLDNNENA